MTFFKNIKVRSKFACMIGFSLLSSILLGLFAYMQVNSMAKDMEIIYEEKVLPNSWISHAVQINLHIDRILIEMMFVEDLDEKKALREELNEGVDTVFANFAIYESMDLSEEEQNEIAHFYEAVGDLTGTQDEMIDLALAGNTEAANALFLSTVKPARENLVMALSNSTFAVEYLTSSLDRTSLPSDQKLI